jgi:Xaa-Pro dipeptidase
LIVNKDIKTNIIPMKTSRRHFLKIGGLSVAVSGFVPTALSSCTPEEKKTIFANELEGVKALTKEDFDERLQKLVKSMSGYDIEAIFIEGATNLKYFFNLSWWLSERIFGAVVNTKGEPIWICPAFEEERALEQVPENHEIRTWEEHESPYKLFTEIITDLGISGKKVAMGPTVRSFLSQSIRRELPGELIDGSLAINMVRAIKNEREIEYMDIANRITKKAYRYAFENLSEGMSNNDMAQKISFAHSEMGTSGRGGPQIGFTSAYPHGTRQSRDLHEGDIILVDGGCSVEGFRSDVTRTIVFGSASDRQKEVFNVVLEAQQAAHNAIKPGVTCGEIDRAARKLIEDKGFGPDYKYFAHRLGHGIGMDGHEFPYLVKDNPLILEPGMTFSNEPGIYIYGEFGVRIEDCFVVTEDGAKMLGGMLTTAIDKPFGD